MEVAYRKYRNMSTPPVSSNIRYTASLLMLGYVSNPCSWPQTLFIWLVYGYATLSIYALFLLTPKHTRLVAGASDRFRNSHRRCRMSFSVWVMNMNFASHVRPDLRSWWLSYCRHHDTGRKCFSCAGPAIPSHITQLGNDVVGVRHPMMQL